jgi:L-2-hydroxyglutarate oxidase LhgO
MESIDVLIVGAGVVGLAIAARLSQQYTNVILVDKNSTFGEETSSRNSEVIHAGIYYPQSSLKAKLCVRGKQLLYQYCQQRHIPHQRVGKLLVAHGKQEEIYLAETLKQAKLNGVDDLVWQSKTQLQESTPALAATAALLSPSTGIIDVHSYMQSLLADAERNSALFVAQTTFISATVNKLGLEVVLNSQGETSTLQCQHIINCAGLHATEVATTITDMPVSQIPKLHYCRGHYFSYQGKSPFKQLIYPIPEANGLGIHASLNTAGQLKFGPDTEYIETIDYQVPETLKAKFVEAITKYFPEVDHNKLIPDYAGIRPKLQGPNDDFKDFCIQTAKQHKVAGLINLFGIDSPGLTSSLAIAEYIEHLMINKKPS